MQIDHVAIAVRSVETAADRLCALTGYKRKTEKVTNTRHKVNVLFLEKDASLDIKLIEPSDAESPLWAFLKKGGGLHHVCFKVADVTASCDELKGKGVRILAEPAPGEAFDEGLIAFCYLGLGVSAELIDTDARRRLISSAVS